MRETDNPQKEGERVMNAVLAFLDAYRGVVLIATIVIIMAVEWVFATL